MIVVRVTSQLQHKLSATSLAPSLLIERFSFWKENGQDSSYWFGRDQTDPATQLSHAHMAPVTPGADKDGWDEAWSKRQHGKRKSDGYVLYTHHSRYGYLLIDVLFDPGAHDLWIPSHKQQLIGYETVADNFQFNGSTP